MKIGVLLLALILFSLIAFTQKTKFDFEFSIIFGGCFNGDSISLKLDSILIVEKVKLKSNIVGSAVFSVTQNHKNLSVRHYESKEILQRVKTKPRLGFAVSINNRWVNYSFDLKKGKIIYVQFCWDEAHKRTILIRQQDYPVFFL